MEIQLQDFDNGKPVVLNVNKDVAQKIKTLRDQKKYRQIIEIIDELPCNKQKYLIKSNALLHLKNWPQLLKCCDKGLTISQESQFYNLKGKALGKMGKHQQKIEFIHRAIQINQKVPAYHRNLGAALYSLKKYQQAIKSHTQAIKLQPNNAINYHNKGAAMFRLEQYQSAKQYFQLAIQKDKKLALSYSWLGDCQKQMKNYQKAAQLYQQAYELSGNVVYQKQKQKLQKQFNVEKKQKKKFFGLFG